MSKVFQDALVVSAGDWPCTVTEPQILSKSLASVTLHDHKQSWILFQAEKLT